MLTGDLVKPRLRTRLGRLYVQMLSANETYLRIADELINLFNNYVGKTRREWREALENYEGERTDYIIVRGLAKVLEDGAVYSARPTAIEPSELRRELFARGPVFEHPDLFHPQTRGDVLTVFAQTLDISVEEVEAALFGDQPSEYILVDAGTWTPQKLIVRYNLELARGVLYWCSEMRVDIYDHYKDFWRYLKLFKLMFSASPRDDGGYHISLDGPISPFVKATTRYGRQFAAFLPALLLGDKWQMSADVRLASSKPVVEYRLDHKTALQSHFRRSGEFDSQLEADFALEFETKFGGERGAWRLERESEVLLLGDTVMIPDFAASHKRDGRRALIEIVGFWHPAAGLRRRESE
jgi:hypothetical protein